MLTGTWDFAEPETHSQEKLPFGETQVGVEESILREFGRTSGCIVQNALRDCGRQNVTYFFKKTLELPVAIAKAAVDELVSEGH